MRLLEELLLLDREERPIRVAVAGTGQMGTDLVCQIAGMPGMEVVVVGEIAPERARRAFELAGFSSDSIVEKSSTTQVEDEIGRRNRVICPDISVLPKLEGVDVVVDATGIPGVGAKLAWECIIATKDIVMLNVEADVTVGSILKHLAESAGVVYTGSAGDEPAATLELFDFARTLGFEVVAAGKGKNNPLDRGATPQQLERTAVEQEMGVKMLTSFVDGTKTMVEMTALSNATGLVPDVSGMHGPTVPHFKELPAVFSTKEQGGVLAREGVVDFALGDVAPGVFVVFKSNGERIEKSLRYSKMGEGPNHVLYRPYHLISLETPLSVARAHLRRESTISSKGAPVSETTAIAKRDLSPGERIDGIGGYTIFGSIDTVETAAKQGLVPMGLLDGASVLKPIGKGDKITFDMVEIDTSSTIYHLRRLQDEYFQTR